MQHARESRRSHDAKMVTKIAKVEPHFRLDLFLASATGFETFLCTSNKSLGEAPALVAAVSSHWSKATCSMFQRPQSERTTTNPHRANHLFSERQQNSSKLQVTTTLLAQCPWAFFLTSNCAAAVSRASKPVLPPDVMDLLRQLRVYSVRDERFLSLVS